MPRIPRNPGSGKPPCNTPSRGAGQGQGWGGPASGVAASGTERPELSAYQERTGETTRRREDREQMAERWLAKIDALADDPAVRPETIVTAGVAIMNRVWGLPQARVEHSGEIAQLSAEPMTPEQWEEKYSGKE